MADHERIWFEPECCVDKATGERLVALIAGWEKRVEELEAENKLLLWKLNQWRNLVSWQRLQKGDDGFMKFDKIP